jgi:hypothetical protein
MGSLDGKTENLEKSDIAMLFLVASFSPAVSRTESQPEGWPFGLF